MGLRISADPDVGPRGWDNQRADSIERRPIANDRAVCIDVGKAFAARDALISLYRIIDVMKMRLAGRDNRLDRSNRQNPTIAHALRRARSVPTQHAIG